MGKYPKEIKVFIFSSFINSMGSAFMWPLVTLYVHNVLGKSFGEAGLVLLLQGLAGIVGQLVGGGLFYRLGPKVLIIGSLMLSGLLQLLLIVTDWPAYVAIMMALGFLNSVSRPVINSIIGFRWKKERMELFNVVYVGNNVGLAIGSALSGVLAAISFNLTFIINGISTLLFALYFIKLLQNVSIKDLTGVRSAKEQQTHIERPTLLLSNVKLYLFLCVGSLFLSFATSQWNTGVAPFLDEKGFSSAYYSFLWTINGIIILIGQPLLIYIKRKLMTTLVNQITGSAILYSIGFTYTLFFHDNYIHFIIAMIITTFGEMLIAPAKPAFITERANLAAPFYLGIVGAFESVGRLFGPYVYGNVYDIWGASPIFLITSTFTIITVIAFIVHAKINRESTKEDHHSTRVQQKII